MIARYDAHTHLNHESLYPDWRLYLQSFADQGGKGLINVGANLSYNTKALEISKIALEEYPNIWVKATIGIHPCDVQNAWSLEPEIAQLEQSWMQNWDHIVAIGETGIDLHYPEGKETLQLQQAFCRAQCDLARKLELPIVIHSRDAFEETMEILEAYTDLTLYFHCWSYGVNELKQVLKIFPSVYIGFVGVITYPKAEEIRQALLLTPKDKILIETDAPYLAPQHIRWKRNTPDQVATIGQYISDMMHIGEEDLRKQIESNFYSLYQKRA